ncbi:hypothetical protein [Tunturiibacter gelidiferens]|uniref:hypothetical protein n=1 Tax=Tunturiibacter gelidiferens TaxID=3069689 RepID=UPI003D9B21D1
MSTTPTTEAPTVTSIFSSSIFHDHIRTWTFVILAASTVGFLYVHESNANAARNALASQAVQQGQVQQATIDKQIQAIHADTQTQVAAIQQQIQAVQTVQQAIAALKQASPAPITITPLITTPATPTTPAVTTAADKAAGTVPVATITGNDLKTLADNAMSCKEQSVELNSCKQTVTLEKQKEADLTTENVALKKIKIQPAWKKMLTTIGQVLLGVAVGRAF